MPPALAGNVSDAKGLCQSLACRGAHVQVQDADLKIAAAIGLVYGTSYHALFDRGQLTAQDTGGTRVFLQALFPVAERMNELQRRMTSLIILP